MQWSFDRGFLQYVNLLEQERLERLAAKLVYAYAEEGNWNFLRETPGKMPQLIIETLSELAPQVEVTDPIDMRQGPIKRRGFYRLQRRILLLDAERIPLFDHNNASEIDNLKSITHQGQVVGYLGLLPHSETGGIYALLSEERSGRGFVSAKTGSGPDPPRPHAAGTGRHGHLQGDTFLFQRADYHGHGPGQGGTAPSRQRGRGSFWTNPVNGRRCTETTWDLRPWSLSCSVFWLPTQVEFLAARNLWTGSTLTSGLSTTVLLIVISRSCAGRSTPYPQMSI